MCQSRENPFFRLTGGVVAMIFGLTVLMPSPVYAQGAGVWPATGLPVPGTMVGPSSAYAPVLLKGVKVFADNPLRFDFIIDTGDGELGDVGAKNFSPLRKDAINRVSTKLIKYFLAALTVPEEDLWVNLSPYEKDRIIPEAFGVTEMGKDLLGQDYLLKQLTSTLMYPEGEIGEEFWERVYKEAYARYGTTDIPVNTFNKVWIVPEKAAVYENAKTNTAFVVESRLKVMLEGDYLALEQNANSKKFGTGQIETKEVKQISDLSSEIVRQVILPAIEKEVNEGKTFAVLRQIYHSMILAAWYKRKLKQAIEANGRSSLLGKIYVDQNKTAGVDVEDKEIKQKIYDQYIAAFKKGVYNYIREDYDPNSGMMIQRKYFAGGFGWIPFGKGASSVLRVVQKVSSPIRDSLQASSGVVIAKAFFDLFGGEGKMPVVSSLVEEVPAHDMDVKETEKPKNGKTEKQNFDDSGEPSQKPASSAAEQKQQPSASPMITKNPVIKTDGSSSVLNNKREKTLKILHLTQNLLRTKKAGQVFPRLYGELQEIFENLKRAAEEEEDISLKEAEIYLIDSQEISAFAIPEQEIVGISTGLIRLLDEHHRLSKDAIAWVLAHEIRHIVQAKIFKGKSRTIIEEEKKRFAEEIDSDLEVLEVMDSAGYNVLSAQEFFEAVEEFDKTKKINESLKIAVEIIDEHLPHDKRIQYLEEKVRSSLWVNTGGRKFFGKEALEELSQSRTSVRQMEEELKEISDFDALKGLMEKYSSKEKFKNTVFFYGILILAGKIVKSVAEKLSKEKDNKWVKEDIEGYVFADLIDRNYSEKVLALYPTLERERLMFIDHYQNLINLHRRKKKLQAYFKQWSGYADYEQKRLEFNEEYQHLIKETGQGPLFKLFFSFLIRRSLRIGSGEVETEFKRELIGQEHQRGDIEELKELRLYSLSLQDIVKQNINWQWFNRIRFEVALKKEAIYFKEFSLEEKEYLLKVLKEKGEEFLSPIFDNAEFMAYSQIILKSSLSDREKVELFLQYPFLLKGASFNDSVLKEVFKTIYNYYLSAPREDKEKIEAFIKEEIENIPDYQRVWKYTLVPYALDALRKKDPSLISLWELSADNISDEWDEYKESRSLSSWEKVELLAKIIDYFSSSKYEEKNWLLDHLWDAIFGKRYSEQLGGIFSDSNLAEYVISRSKEILKQAGIKYRREPDKITAGLIFFFTQGGYITPFIFNEMPERIEDADNLKTLALFLNSSYLENIHKKNNIERKEGQRAIFSLAVLEPDNVLNNSYFYSPSSWAETILLLSLKVFLKEIKGKVSSWQEYERLFYLSPKKIQEWLKKDTTDPLKYYIIEEKASAFTSKQYEPLLKNLIKEMVPLYAEKRDFLKSPFDYFNLFSYIFNSDLNFEELYRKISLYLPATSLRNHILFVLLLREFKKEDPDFEYQSLVSLEKYLNNLPQDKKQRFLSLIEKISPLLVPDNRLTTINLALLGYLGLKVKGRKESGIGGRRDPLSAIIERKAQRSLFPPFSELFSYLSNYLLSQIESRFLKKKFLKRAKEIFRQRGIKKNILSEDPSLINSIVSNYYKEKILTLIYSEEEFTWLRKLILKRITKLREKKEVEKENILFFDFNHPRKPAQLDASLPFLLRSRIEERITSGNFKDALKYITTIFKHPQPARDKYLIKLLEFHIEKFKKTAGDNPSPFQLKSLLDNLQEIKQHFYKPYFKEEVALKQFTLAREIRLREKGTQELSLDEDVSLIKGYFPSASYSRDELLRGLLWEVETFEDYEEVKSLFLKEGILKEGDKIDKLFYEEKLKILVENLAPSEKKDFLLWMLDIKAKPLFLREYEEFLGITFEPLKEMFSSKKEPFSFVSLSTKKFFKHRGENLRKLFVEEMFTGRGGIFSEEELFAGFIEELFQGIMQGVKLKGISPTTLKNIFKTTLLTSPQYKQLKIMQVLGVILARSSGKGRVSSYELIARFMESLGIMGVKIAQVLASSEEIELPVELKRAFQRLTSQAEPEDKQFIFETVKNLRLRVLIKKVRQVMGSGSIGVVYDIEFNDDSAREIVAKIIRPEVDQVLENDLEVFAEVINKLRKQKIKIPSGFEERVVEEIREDADFQKEKQNTDLLREQLKDFGKEYHLSSGEKIEFYVPDYLASSNRKIIFKEKVKGMTLNEEDRLKEIFSPEEINQIKEAIFDFLMRQMFLKGKYLADPQPGNFLIEREKDGSVKINLIDVGSVKDFSATSENIQKLLRELYLIKKGVRTQGEHIYTALFFKKLEYLGVNSQQVIDWIESQKKVKISRKDIIKDYLRGKMWRTSSPLSKETQHKKEDSPPEDTRNFVMSTSIQPDKSSSSLQDNALSSTPGGIDLTSGGLDLETTGEGIEFQIDWAATGLPCFDEDKDGTCERLDEERVQEMNINGLTPVIFQIQPVGNLPLLLGIKEEEEDVLELSAR